MNVNNGSYPKGDLRNILGKRYDYDNEEIVFCTENNMKQSLHILSEEFESFGITPVTSDNDLQTSESQKELFIKLINVTWNLIHKHRFLGVLYNQLADSNRKTLRDDINLKNLVKRLKEDLQKKDHALCQAQERERRLKVQHENALRSLKNEKDEIRKLLKQAQSKDIQHEHEVKRMIQNSHKLQEQLQKSSGTFVSRDKAMQKLQADHEKELTMYKQTVCRLEENNMQMLREINDLKDALTLYRDGLDLHIEASGGWSDITPKSK